MENGLYSLQRNDDAVKDYVTRDKEEKEKMKVHADKRNSAKESKLKVGDYVLMQVPKSNKLSMPFNPKPYQVISVKGSMVTVSNAEHTVTRNVPFFKYLPNYNKPEEDEQDDDDEEDNGNYGDGVAGAQQQVIVEETQQDPLDMEPRYHLRQNRRRADYYRS